MAKKALACSSFVIFYCSGVVMCSTRLVHGKYFYFFEGGWEKENLDWGSIRRMKSASDGV